MTVRDGIRGWLMTNFGGSVTWADQGGKLPDRMFVTAKVASVRAEGQAHVGSIDDDGVLLIQQTTLSMLHVNVYGGEVGEAIDSAVALRNSLEKVRVREALNSAGLAFVQVLREPLDMTTVVGTNFESRASFDVQFRSNQIIPEDIGWIEKVEINGNVVSVFNPPIG